MKDKIREEFRGHLNKLLELEGGLEVHRNKGEKSITYAGIYRAANPSWKGWKYIDKGQEPPFKLIEDFYWDNFYLPFIDIEDPRIRFFLFQFAVNSSPRIATKILQRVLGIKADGIIGPITKQALTDYLQEHSYREFLKDYALAAISFYNNLARNKKYRIFLRGWINRVLKALEYAERIQTEEANNGIV